VRVAMFMALVAPMGGRRSSVMPKLSADSRCRPGTGIVKISSGRDLVAPSAEGRGEAQQPRLRAMRIAVAFGAGGASVEELYPSVKN
jgi:hypothetical protein